MSRKQFIENQGATCKNWNWSWSFINEKEKVIIFGAWDRNTEACYAKNLSKPWRILIDFFSAKNLHTTGANAGRGKGKYSSTERVYNQLVWISRVS